MIKSCITSKCSTIHLGSFWHAGKQKEAKERKGFYRVRCTENKLSHRSTCQHLSTSLSALGEGLAPPDEQNGLVWHCLAHELGAAYPVLRHHSNKCISSLYRVT
ncbi:UNVERIFIED_CONTAM: hypothetical protein K2H54_036839 [Gekko kuhli]